jgi:hypothetical protein
VKLFLSDLDAKFSKSIDWADAASGRTGRYALVIDHGKVTYADIETERGALKVSFKPMPEGFSGRNLCVLTSITNWAYSVKKSGADTVLASL